MPSQKPTKEKPKKIDYDAIQRSIEKAMSTPVVKHEHQVKNCISYWFPKLQAAGVPIPETLIYDAKVGLYEFLNVYENIPSIELKEKFGDLVAFVLVACHKLGYPAFLRTGWVSGKHNWKDTCFLQEPLMLTETQNIKKHLIELIGVSGYASAPMDIWAVREMLPTIPFFTAFAGDMPITQEFRFFVKHGEILGYIPYWPEKAFLNQKTSIPSAEVATTLNKLNVLADPAKSTIVPIVQKVADQFKEDKDGWSVDLLATEVGWYVTDMALDYTSYGFKHDLRTL